MFVSFSLLLIAVALRFQQHFTHTIYRVLWKKIARSLMHNSFATVRRSVTRFSLNSATVGNPDSKVHCPAVAELLFPPDDLELLSMILTFELDLDSIKTNQRAKYLGSVPLVQKLLSGYTHRHTQWVDCSTWTKKVVGNKFHVSLNLLLG